MPVKLHSASGDDEGDAARIEIIPLIDIMFFLLAAFMLVSLSMTHLHRVPLDLPSAASANPENEPAPVQLAVDAQGVVTWDTQVVALSEVTRRLVAAGPATHVMISADAETRHRQVVAVIDAVRAAQIEKVSIETRKAPE